MDKLITLVSCIIDMLILKTYTDGMFGKISGKLKVIGFYIALLGTELLLTANLEFFVDQMSLNSTFVSSLISLITTALLCLFYTFTVGKILFNSILFQVIILASEEICILIEKYFGTTSLDMLDEKQYLYTMNLLSKILTLLVVLVLIYFKGKDRKERDYEYQILTFLTPVFSMILLIFLPVDQNSVNSNRFFYELFIIFISLLNITNSYFLRKISDNHAEKIAHIELLKQLDYQKEKYSSLSESYRNSRRLIHDTKNHYFEIQENIKNKNYENLTKYLDNAISDLESTYAKYNTGNLVIDSLLTYYDTVSKERNIEFSVRLNIDYHRIPVNDYELCIILGNLLDNCINACINQRNKPYFINIAICEANNNKLIIECENSYDANPDTRKTDNINHGYGIKNIQNTLDKYHGVLKTEKSEKYSVTILIPITDIKQRNHRLLYQSTGSSLYPSYEDNPAL